MVHILNSQICSGPPLSPIHYQSIHKISYINYPTGLYPSLISLACTQHCAHLASDPQVKKTPPLSGSATGDLNPHSLSPELGLLTTTVPIAQCRGKFQGRWHPVSVRKKCHNCFGMSAMNKEAGRHTTKSKSDQRKINRTTSKF